MYKALTLIPAWVKEDHFPSCFPLISSKLRPFVCCKPAPNTVTPPSVDPCAALLLLLPGACWAETVSELHPSLNCILISSLAIISSLFGIFFKGYRQTYIFPDFLAVCSVFQRHVLLLFLLLLAASRSSLCLLEWRKFCQVLGLPTGRACLCFVPLHLGAH